MKNPLLWCLSVWTCCFLFPPVLFGQPVVSNVRAQQGSGDQAGLVMITYDLASPAGPCTVSLLISADGGGSFNVPAHTLSGAVGPGIEPGANRVITWDAGADWPGQYSARMRFRVIADDGVVVVPQRVIALSGDLSFGEVTVGQSVTRTLTLSSTGNTELIVTGIMSALGFQAAWAGVIPAGESREVPVTFAPSAVRSYSGMLTVNSDATGGLNQIEVSGTGTAAPTATRVIALSGDLSFGSVTVGQTATRTLTIGNTGNSPLTVSSLSYPGGFSGNWSGGTIAAGGNRSVTVTFAPTAAQSYSGNVTVNSDATSGTNTRAVSGTGVPEDSPAPAGFSLIPAGTYARGDHKNEPEDWMERSRPVHNVHVSAFYMARTPVTYAEWREVYDWAVANGYTFDNAGQRGSNSSGHALPDTPENNQHPVTQVNWYDVVKWSNAKSERAGLTPVYYTNDARTTVYRQGRHDVTIAQVNWSANGYRLPTEAEWEKAARGGLVGARWPWGDAAIDGTRANYWGSGGTNGTTPVGSYAANGYELYDMAGNVWEWNWDWSSDTWYSQAGASEADTRGPVSGSLRVRRGGSWYFSPVLCRVAIRRRDSPEIQWLNLGFRLARTQ